LLHSAVCACGTELRELGLKPGRKLKFEYAELKQSEMAQAEDVALIQHVEVQSSRITHAPLTQS
jgi:hypothetical protein